MRCELNSKFERFSECVDAIACEYENFFMKYENKHVSSHALETALFEKQIDFVKKHDIVSDFLEILNRFKLFFNVLSFNTHVFACYEIKKLLYDLTPFFAISV